MSAKRRGRKSKKKVLFFSCSGASSAAEAADGAARKLTNGAGSMACLAGLGAGNEGMIKEAMNADLNVVINGCRFDCAKRIFEKIGLTNFIQVRVTDLGMKRVKGERATEGQVAAVVEKVREVIPEV